MNCNERDQSLLLLAVGELGWIERTVTRIHLAGCTRCRAKLDEMTATSRMIASSIRPITRGTGRLAPLLSMRNMVALFVLVATITMLLVRYAGTAQPKVDDRPCAPGIASDKCR